MIDIVRVMALSLVDGRSTSTNQIAIPIGTGTKTRKALSRPINPVSSSMLTITPGLHITWIKKEGKTHLLNIVPFD